MYRKTKSGFTLVEMMMVIAIMAVLLAIAIPVYSTVVESGNVREFEANHEMIVSSINMYTAAHNGSYPTQKEHLNAYLYGASGDTTSLDALDTPKGAVYNVTFGDVRTRPTVKSTYKEHQLPKP